jgi:2-succinyl-5-enolpyruvyl-6-hydroxy-3-cyclohexene-1-carboxylate synthase
MHEEFYFCVKNRLGQLISSIPSTQIIVQLCKKANIKHIVISPGSRNAPLTISFAIDPFFKTYSVVDERCAAFFAMGMAQQLRESTAIVCTSGSAMLNYFPAVSEAFYSQIPMLVISADRPEHLIDVGDGQTIRQKFVYNEHVGYEAHLKSDNRNGDNQEVQSYNLKEVSNAIKTAKQKSLPVHINAPFDEPLYHKTETLIEGLQDFRFDASEQNVDNTEKLQKFVKAWKHSNKKMILVGVNHPEDLKAEDLSDLVKDDDVIILTETTSNLNHPEFFFSIDGIIAPIELDERKAQFFEQLQPDLLLTFGGMLVSKKLKAFLRTYKPKYHFHVHPQFGFNTFFADMQLIQMSPTAFLNEVSSQLFPKESDYFGSWFEIHKDRIHKTKRYIEEIPYSDFWCYDQLFKALPEDILLHLGNSSCVRYSNLFDLKSGTQVFCNRGTSGIDGSTSTAVGGAVISDKPTYIITGDLSFLYDSNGLWNDNIPSNFKIIVINNRGGGIFRILPGDKHDQYFHTYFETQHELDSSHLAKMFKFEYFTLYSKDNFNKTLSDFINNDNKSVLEVFTPTELNDKVLLEYFRYIK